MGIYFAIIKCVEVINAIAALLIVAITKKRRSKLLITKETAVKTYVICLLLILVPLIIDHISAFIVSALN